MDKFEKYERRVFSFEPRREAFNLHPLLGYDVLEEKASGRLLNLAIEEVKRLHPGLETRLLRKETLSHPEVAGILGFDRNSVRHYVSQSQYELTSAGSGLVNTQSVIAFLLTRRKDGAYWFVKDDWSWEKFAMLNPLAKSPAYSHPSPVESILDMVGFEPYVQGFSSLAISDLDSLAKLPSGRDLMACLMKDKLGYSAAKEISITDSFTFRRFGELTDLTRDGVRSAAREGRLDSPDGRITRSSGFRFVVSHNYSTRWELDRKSDFVRKAA